MSSASAPADLFDRLNALAPRAKALESEGLAFPSLELAESVSSAIAQGKLDEATETLRRGEALLARVAKDWVWVRELIVRAEELREIGAALGVDVAHLDARVGNAREQLHDTPISSGSMERAAASASLAVAVLSDAIPKFAVQEAQRLGASIQAARNRGEDVGPATIAFGRLLRAMHDDQLPVTATCVLELRKEVARIPRASAVGPLPENEEEEILLEARSLARRLHKIKGRARDAQSAARLMSEVRAALSEDRRFGTPEEEIEELWNEVDRLTREHQNVEPPFARPLVAEDPVPAREPEPPARSARRRN